MSVSLQWKFNILPPKSVLFIIEVFIFTKVSVNLWFFLPQSSLLLKLEHLAFISFILCLGFGFFFLIGNSLVQELSLAMFVKYIAEWGINPTWGFSCCCVARQNILALKSPIKIFFLLLSVIAISGKKKTKNPTKSKSNLVTRSIFHLNGQKSKDLIW